jgi:hypothetical protein
MGAERCSFSKIAKFRRSNPSSNTKQGEGKVDKAVSVVLTVGLLKKKDY